MRGGTVGARLGLSRAKDASMPRTRTHSRFALKTGKTRQACAAYKYLMAAILTANKLPKPVLLTLRNHICEAAKGRKGWEWDLMRAYATFLEEQPKTAKIRKRQELYRLQVV